MKHALIKNTKITQVNQGFLFKFLLKILSDVVLKAESEGCVYLYIFIQHIRRKSKIKRFVIHLSSVVSTSIA